MSQRLPANLGVVEVDLPGRSVMACTTIFGITIWGFTVGLTQGCVEPSAPLQKIEVPAVQTVVSENWFPLVDRSDVDPADPEAGTVYLFKDGDLKRWASESCRDTAPEIDASDQQNLKVLIVRVKNRDLSDYSVKCKAPPKVG
jgi:hypothetical protein